MLPSTVYFTLKTYLKPTVFLFSRWLYSHIWWFSKFQISSSIAFFHYLEWTRSKIASWYIADSCTLLLVSITEMIFSFSTTIITLLGSLRPPTSAGFSSNSLVTTVGGKVLGATRASFCERLLNFGSLVGVFRLSQTEVSSQLMSIKCLMRSFAPCSNSSMYGLLTISIYWVLGTHIQMCFIIFRL